MRELELVLQAGRVARFGWRLDGDASYSPRFLEQLGLTTEDAPPRHTFFLSRLHGDDAEHLLSRVSAVSASGSREPFECEYRLAVASGEHRWFRAVMELSFDAQGQVAGVEAAQVDVHALRMAETRLLSLNVELGRLASAREEFLSSMSHELRTPLNAVLGQAQAMTEGTFGALTPAMREALDVISASGAHLLTLLNSVLDLARLEAGGVTLRREPTSVQALCREALHVVSPQARAKGVELVLVGSGPDDLATLDRLRARQILVNLLSNAVKFSPPGRAVTLEVQHEAEAWAFVVRDEGPGIDPADQRRLFHPFVQASGGRARRHDGAGLGLALVKRLVDLHGGSIELSSALGHGARFTARLPIEPPEETLATPAPGLKALRSVMIVDDTIINVEPLRRYLTRLGVEVRVAESGPQALELVARQAPQVMFLDWHMPGMDGSEVIRRVRQEPYGRELRIVTLTALVGDHVKAEALAAGADAFLPKPARLAEALELAENLARTLKPRG